MNGGGGRGLRDMEPGPVGLVTQVQLAHHHHGPQQQQQQQQQRDQVMRHGTEVTEDDGTAVTVIIISVSFLQNKTPTYFHILHVME